MITNEEGLVTNEEGIVTNEEGVVTNEEILPQTNDEGLEKLTPSSKPRQSSNYPSELSYRNSDQRGQPSEAYTNRNRTGSDQVPNPLASNLTSIRQSEHVYGPPNPQDSISRVLPEQTSVRRSLQETQRSVKFDLEPEQEPRGDELNFDTSIFNTLDEQSIELSIKMHSQTDPEAAQRLCEIYAKTQREMRRLSSIDAGARDLLGNSAAMGSEKEEQKEESKDPPQNSPEHPV